MSQRLWFVAVPATAMVGLLATALAWKATLSSEAASCVAIISFALLQLVMNAHVVSLRQNSQKRRETVL